VESSEGISREIFEHVRGEFTKGHMKTKKGILEKGLKD
jgi:hypothetical protein